jgi:hypothetical protein
VERAASGVHSGRTQAVLHLDVEDRWTLDQLGPLLVRLDRVYKRVSGILAASSIPYLDRNRAEAERLRAVLPGVLMHFGRSSGHHQEYVQFIEEQPRPEGNLGALMSRVEDAVSQVGDVSTLYVRGIEIHSPGWVEVTGAMNPLTIIADFITENRRITVERVRSRWEVEGKERELLQKTVQALSERGAFDTSESKDQLLDWYMYYAATRVLPELEELALNHQVTRVYLTAEQSA